MNWLHQIVFRVRAVLGKRHKDRVLEEELKTHLALLVEQNVARGMSLETARREAKLSLGGADQIKESVHDHRGLPLLETFVQDLRYAFRVLRKSPGFTTVAVLTLALGIGANTAIFSAVNGILLKPLPYDDSARLATIDAHKMWKFADRYIQGTVSLPMDVWQQVQKQIPAIERMAPYESGDVTISGDAAPEKVSAVYVSSDFFPLLGVRPLAGRPILPGDMQPGAKPVAVASYALWRERWGGDERAIGLTVTLDQKAYTLVGVMPTQFDFGLYFDRNGVWVPQVAEHGRAPQSLSAVARLKKGVTREEVNAQLKAISPRFSNELSVFGGGVTLGASSLGSSISDLGDELLILLGAVAFVLLIACVNVSGLLLARGWGRRREIAIREALGASRIRIMRQFLTESVLLALASGALGLLFSLWGVRILQVITPKNTPEHGQFLLNTNVLWFTLAVSLFTGIFFGIAPAMQASERQAGVMIKERTSLAGSSGRRSRRLHSALVVLEVALAVVLVIGATLVVRSFSKLVSVRLGFRTDHIVTMTANFTKSVCDLSEEKKFDTCVLASESVLDRIRATPGVQSAAAASNAPLGGWSGLLGLRIEGQQNEVSLNTGALVALRAISPDYFRTLGIRLLAGHDFTNADVNGSQLVAVVDGTFANRYLDGKPLGKRISVRNDEKKKPEWMEIVGEASDTQDVNLKDKPMAEIFVPVGQGTYFQGRSFIARTSTEPQLMIPALRRAIWSVDKDAPITDVKTMEQLLTESVADQHFQAILLGSFGALGLVLSMVGIYGVISYGVTQRTREIGVRMALGAQPANVLRMVIREGMFLAGAGIVVGVAGALALGRVVQTLLFEVKPTDPATFVSVAIALALVAAAACYIPARRAMRVDPMVALRYE